jgi:hypothetical protein
MKIVVADTGALISLALVEKISLIEQVFGEFFIAGAVLIELNKYDNPDFNRQIIEELEKHVIEIKSRNHLSMVMDFGESESVILYEELNAEYLLIDDSKARAIAESLGVKCIGSIGLLLIAKRKGLLKNLKSIFTYWVENGRYFSKPLLNRLLVNSGETPII